MYTLEEYFEYRVVTPLSTCQTIFCVVMHLFLHEPHLYKMTVQDYIKQFREVIEKRKVIKKETDAFFEQKNKKQVPI